MGLVSTFRPPVVGVDFGTHAIRAVALRRRRKGWTLAAAGETPSPAGEDAGGLHTAEIAAELLDNLGVKRARVVAALPSHSVIVKRLALPMMDAAELATAIPWEAEQYIPFPLADVQLDYQVLDGPRALPAAALDVLLVAARRDRVEERLTTVEATGRAAVVLDVEAFALANAYETNYPERDDRLAVLIHVGQRGTIVCLVEHGKIAFTRDINLGGAAYADALQRELALDSAAVHRLLRQRPVADSTAARTIAEVHQQLMLEIRKTLDFHRASSPIERPDRVVLSGGGCAIDGLPALLSTELDAAVELLDPFRQIPRPSRVAGADVDGPAFAVAVGLALRREGDR